MLLFLTVMSVQGWGRPGAPGIRSERHTTGPIDFYQNDSFTGTTDPFFWFLTPLIGIVSAGVCIAFHYTTVLLTQSVGFVCGLFSKRTIATNGKPRATSPAALSSPHSPQRRMITMAILLILVSTFIPYQFAYLVICLVQLMTTVRALRTTSTHHQMARYNFYNYAHSILLLMLWVLPINLPILAVWLRNLAVQWLTPFASHRNILSIVSFIILVENLTTGRMVPRVTNRLQHVTTVLFIGTALYAGVYGVSYAYRLHHLVHIVSTWLVLIYFASGASSFCWVKTVLKEQLVGKQKRGKTP